MQARSRSAFTLSFVGFRKCVVSADLRSYLPFRLSSLPLVVHIRNLTGYTAPKQFLQQLTWVAFHHSPLVRKIDAVRAYHFGTHFLVEIDVLLPDDLRLAEAVHVGIGLEQKIEALPDVERAFVHLNCERTSVRTPEVTDEPARQLATVPVNRRQHKVV